VNWLTDNGLGTCKDRDGIKTQNDAMIASIDKATHYSASDKGDAAVD